MNYSHNGRWFKMAKIEWKTQEEIEAEKNAPQPPTETDLLKEQIATMQGALDFIIMNY
jgi:hypothetical protein